MNVEAVRMLLEHRDINANIRNRAHQQPQDILFTKEDDLTVSSTSNNKLLQIDSLFEAYNSDF